MADDKAERYWWLPFVSARAARYVAYTVATVALVLGGALILQRFDFLVDFSDGSEERPPIIVRNNSIDFSNGSTSDSSTIKASWHDWSEDLTGTEWKPDHTAGYHVNRFDVTVTDAQNCSPKSGKTVTITYRNGNVDTPFVLTVKKKFGVPAFNRKEPKLDRGGVTLTQTSMTSTTPATLTFSAGGYISSLAVGNDTCTFTSSDRPVIRIQPVH